MATKEEVLSAIDSELAYQNHVWPESGDAGDGVLSVGESILLMQKLLREAATAWANESRPEINALHMIRKAVTTGFRAMANHGAPRREGF